MRPNRRIVPPALAPLVTLGGAAAVVTALLLAFLGEPAATAQFAAALPRTETALDHVRRADPRLSPPAHLATTATAGLRPEVRAAWEGFRGAAGGEWRAHFDTASGLLDVAEGAGIPWLPGRGNGLTTADIAPHLGGRPEPDLATLESLARAFLPRVAPLLGLPANGSSLVLARGRSGRFSDYLWYVDFDLVLKGLPVEGARVTFRVNHGNLVQFGSENLPSPGTPVPAARLTREEALDVLAQHLGGSPLGGPGDSWVDPGSRVLLPAEERGGRVLLAAWQFVFRRRGVPGTWRGRVDAATGEVLDFYDVNAYAGATGGVYPSSFADGNETVLPMPFADLSNGTYAGSAGTFPFTPGDAPLTSTLDGLYVGIFDQCGAVSLTSNAAGNLRFRTSSGTDCATPGTGGAGNTHAARTQFFHLNRIMEAGRGWLPSNSWLSGQLTANVNLSQTCNAFWNGYAVNFFRSGGGCGNTGEIAGISLHEYGHGLDQNDGAGFSADNGSGEAYADVTAVLALRDSCLGQGFFPSNCFGYGDPCTSCSSVRDIDWAKHASNTPHTVANFTQVACGNYPFYPGPCGGEGHCESYVASEAVWDLAARDLPDPGSAAAWAVTERLWYLSRPTATTAFSCNTSAATWTSNGCVNGSWWRTMRAVDDDDGNLANGTPHSCHLFAAFDRHGMACAADAGANVCFSACTPPAAPAVTLTPGDGQVQVSWTSAGPGVVYDVYRNDTGCGTGMIRVAGDIAGTAFSDTQVANGFAYSYEVVAHPAGSEACAAAPSTCQAAIPAGPPCSPPPVPTLTATAEGFGSVHLSWTASAGALYYQVSRGTTPGGPYEQIATPAGTSFDDTGLADEATYRYVVRAVDNDECASAPSAEASATTPVCHQGTLYENDFETGDGFADWTVGTLPGHSGASDWRGIESCSAHGGSHAFRFGGPGCDDAYQGSQHTYASPAGAAGIDVPSGAGRTRISFWHTWSFESGFDGGYLTVAVDGGAPVPVPAASLSGATYNGTAYTGAPVFTYYQGDYVETVADLDAACDLATGGSGGCAGHVLSIAFVAVSDSIVQYSGWSLDDVAVTVCGPDCTAPGTPTGVSATAPGDNQAQVSWSGGAPAAAAFNVYRAAGTCAAPGPFTRVGRRVPGPTHLDSGLQGTLTYAYRVTGVDATGFCQSAPSACAEVTATGLCSLPPTFAGLASVSNAETTTCALDLDWPAASSPCPGPITYDVFRSVGASFVPSPANRIATGVSGTSYHDASPLADRTSYFYVVRAVNAPAGVSENNEVRQSAAPTGPVADVTLAESFEAADGFDLEGWEHAPGFGPNDWAWSGQRSKSPSHSWLSPSSDYYGDRVLVSPPFVPGPATTLSFWHTYEFDNAFSCNDAGNLEIRLGSSWHTFDASAFLAGGFNGYTTTYPIFGVAWCGGTLGPMSEVRADLSAWEGQEVRLRWHAADDGQVRYTGWFVDSVVISDVKVIAACTSTPPPAADFYTVPPCRLVDTRRPFEGPPLQPREARTLHLAGACGIPESAVALSVNVTVVQPTAFGHLVLFPANAPAPQASTINFQPGKNRANNAVLSLAPDGLGSVKVLAATNGSVDLIVDVNGYFK